MPYLPKDREVPESKVCRRCGDDKPASAFTSARQNADGLHSYCRDCDNARQRAARAANPPTQEQRQAKRAADRADFQKHYEKRREAQVDARLRSRYGITRDEYNAMLEVQDGRCAICGKEGGGSRGNMLDVDHDHETGKVRGLLCRACNTALGIVERPEWLVKAFAYLGIRDQ